jgi:F-box domain
MTDQLFKAFPIDIVLQIFESLDLKEILGLRLLSQDWRAFIDDEDVSQFILYSPAGFSFQGVKLRNQPEIARFCGERKYAQCMKHLNSRLTGLYSVGPTIKYSIEVPEKSLYAYGNGFLVVEEAGGDEVRIMDVESGDTIQRIKWADLSESKGNSLKSRNLLDIRIKGHVLCLHVFEEVKPVGWSNGRQTLGRFFPPISIGGRSHRGDSPTHFLGTRRGPL